MSTGLFGISHSNRTVDEHWGKNCFNSSFPTAAACYMMAHDIPAIYVKLDVQNGCIRVVNDTISMREVFNCGERAISDLYFSFESVYEPYRQYTFGDIDGIDLVVRENGSGRHLRPLEVKLTVLPDNSTCKKPERKWGSEVVIRSATTSYCAFGMYDGVKAYKREVRDIFEMPCSSVQSWTNDFEMTHKTSTLCMAIDRFQKAFYTHQKPLLMQTIWKTRGKSPLLADNAFDIVIWSDYAFSRLFVDGSEIFNEKMSRPQRASAKLARCLWELSVSDRVHVSDIYRQMAFANQTDKEFAIGGTRWRRYVVSDRIIRPILSKRVVDEIIEPGYIERLSPERRFDQTLYFARNS